MLQVFESFLGAGNKEDLFFSLFFRPIFIRRLGDVIKLREGDYSLVVGITPKWEIPAVAVFILLGNFPL